MKDFLKSPQTVAAIIAAVTSLITLGLTILTKNFIEKRLLIFKLNSEHQFEQRKKIKNVLASYKGHLLTACENLNHRLWNFSNEKHMEWLKVNGDYHNKQNYYFQSFIYRILAVYAWMRKIESELIHLDTTIATKEDLEFIKFMRFYGRIFSDTAFFKGYDYDYCNQTDHIFKSNLDELYRNITRQNEILTYNSYLEEISSREQDELSCLYKLLDGVNLVENRLRWQWFQIMKMFNLAFLNAYGYDYQKTDDVKMKIAISSPMKSKLNGNFIFLLKEHKLEKQKEIKRLIKLINKTK
jgi:hypothetical protein